MNELNPELFTYELYESNFWSRLNMRVCDYLDDEIKKHMIGWCPAERLSFRPRKGDIAVMCEDENSEKFWFHYSKTLLDHVQKS